MSRTLGELVDRLTITNLKLWFVQEKAMVAARDHTALDAESVHQLHQLNLERNRLMTEIDQCLNDSIHIGGARVDARVKIVP